MKTKRWVIVAAAVCSVVAMGLAGGNAAAQGKVSDNVVRIGVLTDMSGQFSHESGQGAVTAVHETQPGRSDRAARATVGERSL